MQSFMLFWRCSGAPYAKHCVEKANGKVSASSLALRDFMNGIAVMIIRSAVQIDNFFPHRALLTSLFNFQV
jgi:hypothetical protein